MMRLNETGVANKGSPVTEVGPAGRLPSKIAKYFTAYQQLNS